MSLETLRDVLQVCLNGHVITDRLRDRPEHGLSRCDRCGAATLHRCPTCGRELPGAVEVPGLAPIGELRPPQHCPKCGAGFPWTARPAPSTDSLALLENLLRRLPRMVRALRVRHGDRPPFRVEDEFDLEDLVRALLPLHFDEVWPESRTPSYAARTRTDFILATEQTAVLVKRVAASLDERQLGEQIEEDVRYYERRGVTRLIALVHDPERRLPVPERLETAWAREREELAVRCVVAS